MKAAVVHIMTINLPKWQDYYNTNTIYPSQMGLINENIYLYVVKLSTILVINIQITIVLVKLAFLLRSEVFTAVTMKNAVFWDVMPSGSCKNRRFGGTQRLHHKGDKNISRN
jgi:hypothetical protein